MTAAVVTATLGLYLEAERLEREWGERKKILATELVSEMELGGEAKHPDGGGVRLVPGSRRFNPDLARQNLPTELYQAICKPVPDSKLANDLLADFPALMAMCQKTTAPSLRLL